MDSIGSPENESIIALYWVSVQGLIFILALLLTREDPVCLPPASMSAMAILGFVDTIKMVEIGKMALSAGIAASYQMNARCCFWRVKITQEDNKSVQG